MKCPKCNTEVGDKDLFCPKCKKVLRLKCPVCNYITKNSVCENCGSVILNKCFKCGRLNSTALEICPTCGLNINASIGLRESVIEEFAVLTIEVENIEDIKNAFNSDKLALQFRKNFYNMVKKLASEKKLRVQMLENTYIIRFCKDYSFLESCSSAVDFAIYIAQSVTEINQKLFDSKGVAIKIKMAIQKRDVYLKPNEYRSGFNVNLMYSSKKSSHLFNNVQVVVDSFIYQTTKSKYPYQSLSAVYVKNQMVMFFELILSSIIKLEDEKKEEAYAVKLPKNIAFEPEEETDNRNLINFSSLNCSFIKVKYDSLLDEMTRIINSDVKNPIICVKSSDKTGRLWNISVESMQERFQTQSVYRFTCPMEAKYEPFGFFKHLMLTYKDITEFDFLQNPTLVDRISADQCLRNLFLLSVNSGIHPEDLHFSYFESFVNFFAGITQRVIFVVDDFHNIDESSLEILKYLIENRNLGNVSFIFASDEHFALHRKIYKLMTSKNFFDIEVRLSSNKSIVAANSNVLKDIENSFYFEKILENTKGSYFYLTQALGYLLNNEILTISGEKYIVEKDRMIVIPKDINELVKKRIQTFATRPAAYRLYISALLLGEKVPYTVLQQLDYDDFVKNLKYLESTGLIQIVNDRVVVSRYYGLFRKNLLSLLEKEEMQEVCQIIIDKILNNLSLPSRIKAEIYEYSSNKKEAFSLWRSLAELSSKIGDFSAYLNTTNKFLSLVNNIIDEDTDKTVDQIKLEVYEEMSSLLYKYYPDKILNFLELLLENLEATNDDNKIKTVANKLVQSCLMSGNYVNALEYVGKIISRTPRSSFNPADPKFNLNYFLINLVTLEIYYNLGRLNECIELGDELFKYIDLNNIVNTILPPGFSKKQFREAIIDAQFFISISRILQLRADTVNYIEKLQSFIPEYCCFKLMLLLAKFLRNENIETELRSFENADFINDKYSQILYPTLQAMVAFKNGDWNGLGNYIYQTKLVASSVNLYQIEYFCDMMIGFAYQKMGNPKKSKQIYFNVLDLASSKGIKNITYLSWYLIACVEKDEANFDMALGVLNNAILNMEKDENISELFTMLFKELSAEILLAQHEYEKALFCANQAHDIVVNYNVNVYAGCVFGILTEVYQQLIATAKDEQTKAFYASKIKQIAGK